MSDSGLVLRKVSGALVNVGQFQHFANSLVPEECPPGEVIQELAKKVKEVCGPQAQLVKQGSRAKHTNIAGSDFDYHIDNTSMPVTRAQMEKICDKAKSIPGITPNTNIIVALKLEYEDDQTSCCIELVPSLSDYFPAGAKTDEPDPFFHGNIQAQNAIRVLKYLFHGMAPKLKSCEIEDLVKGMALGKAWVPRFGLIQAAQSCTDTWQPSDGVGLDLFMKVISEIQKCSLCSWSKARPLQHYGSMVSAQAQRGMRDMHHRQALFHMSLRAARLCERGYSTYREIQSIWPQEVHVRFDKIYNSNISSLTCSASVKFHLPVEDEYYPSYDLEARGEDLQASFCRDTGYIHAACRIGAHQPTEVSTVVQEFVPDLRGDFLNLLCGAINSEPEAALVPVETTRFDNLDRLPCVWRFPSEDHCSNFSKLQVQRHQEGIQVVCKKQEMGCDDGILFFVNLAACGKHSRWRLVQQMLHEACGMRPYYPSWVPGLLHDFHVTFRASCDDGEDVEEITLDAAGCLVVQMRACDYNYGHLTAELQRSLSADELRSITQFNDDVLAPDLARAQQAAISRLQQQLARPSPTSLEASIHQVKDLGVSGTIISEAQAILKRLKEECPPCHQHSNYHYGHAVRCTQLHIGSRRFQWDNQPGGVSIDAPPALSAFCRLLVGDKPAWTGSRTSYPQNVSNQVYLRHGFQSRLLQQSVNPTGSEGVK